MKIEVPYGTKKILELEIDDKQNVEFAEPNNVIIKDESQTITDAINNPLNSPEFKDFLSNAKNLLLIVNDATRPTPTEKILDVIYNDIKNIDFKFIIATGAHRGPTHDEYIQIFGKYYDLIKNRIAVHDSKKDEDMVFLGKSKNKTEMHVNKLCVEADKIIIISSVEPHYFAGYTGGRKSILPGIASYKTIQQNHKLALNPSAKALALEGNPIHEDMIDAIKTVDKEIFSIMTVLDKAHKIYATTAGEINDSFIAATHKANEVFAAKIKEKADIVVSVVQFPADIDLYQAQKGIENAKLALKENGILILVAKCRDGIGGKSFANLLSSYDSAQKVLEKIEKEYVLGYHKAGKIAEITLWAQIWAVTDLEPESLKKLFIKPFDSLQTALDKAIKERQENPKILFLFDASLTVPIID